MTVSDLSEYSYNSSCNDLPLSQSALESASQLSLSDSGMLGFAPSSAAANERDRGWNLLDMLCSDIDSEHYDSAENLMEDGDPTMPDCADEQPVSVPLYKGSTITVSEAILLVLQFSLRFAY